MILPAWHTDRNNNNSDGYPEDILENTPFISSPLKKVQQLLLVFTMFRRRAYKMGKAMKTFLGGSYKYKTWPFTWLEQQSHIKSYSKINRVFTITAKRHNGLSSRKYPIFLLIGLFTKAMKL